MNLDPLWFIFVVAIHKITKCIASDDENRLMVQLFRTYNSLIRPVKSVNETIEIDMQLQLVLLISVNEKIQIMHTNVWLTLNWIDFQMRWEPMEYGGIRTIRIPPDKLWLPDMVLFNNADGGYEVSFYSNVVVAHNGGMLWVPPAIYKSSCIIDVEHFPFDEQLCKMKFGSWTFNNTEVQLAHKVKAITLSEFKHSSIWDVIDCPAYLSKDRGRIDYHLRLRRKALFYTVVLIIPTVLMAFLSMMVFYLPTDAGEKISLSISILLSLVVFLLLVSKILPPTSKTIPLMAKYLLLTFVLNVVTIMVTVVIINIFFRGPTTHRMPKWVEKLFLYFLPLLMCMKRPKRYQTVRMPVDPLATSNRRDGDVASIGDTNESLVGERLIQPPVGVDSMPLQELKHHPQCIFARSSPQPQPSPQFGHSPILEHSINGTAEADRQFHDSSANSMLMPLTTEAYRALAAIDYITEHLREDDEIRKHKEDWKYVAMVIDRLMLYIFFGVTLGGSLLIILSAPTVFEHVDQTHIVDKLKAQYKWE